MSSIYKPVDNIDSAVRVTLMMLVDDLKAAGYEELSINIRFKDDTKNRLLYYFDGEWREQR